jgi:SAM-dependent methyltransferase
MTSYRTSHTMANYGLKYDEAYKRPYKQLCFAEEKRLLEGIIRERITNGGKQKYLDFACGTGRILAYVAPSFETSMGIDISEEMQKLARAKCQGTRFLLGDITTDDYVRKEADAAGPFDLITSFRFFLNAEHELRAKVLHALQPLLSPDGSFVFNVHKNQTSLTWWPKARKQKRRGENPESITTAYVSGICGEAGFRIVSMHGYMFLPVNMALRAPRFWWVIDRLLGRVPFVKKLGHCVIYVVRKA